MPDVLKGNQVAVAHDSAVAGYASERDAFSPDTQFPEYSGKLSAEPNAAYRLVRNALIELGLDAERVGTADWNPLGELIQPGQFVTLKPNWVLHRNESGMGEDCLYTHASVVRAVLDYVYLARPGRIVVGDAPIQGCDLETLWCNGNYPTIVDYFADRQPTVEFIDFRRTILKRSLGKEVQYGDQRPLDRYVLFDLAENSYLEPIAEDWKKFRVTQYDPDVIHQHHRPGLHRYLVAREVVDADVLINIPKLKTHMKAGITGTLKNLVGINGHKEYLPHHRKGGSEAGGDCYEGYSVLKNFGEHLGDFSNRRLDRPNPVIDRILSLFSRAWAKPLRMRGEDTLLEGAWHGNDTVWRMCLDLNRILLFGCGDGSLAEKPQRKVLHVTDAIVAGENNGPLAPTPITIGTVTAGWNPVAVDYVNTHIMGFDWEKIPLIRHAFDQDARLLADFLPQAVEILSAGQVLPQPWGEWSTRPFSAAPGWTHQCEMDPASVPISSPQS